MLTFYYPGIAQGVAAFFKDDVRYYDLGLRFNSLLCVVRFQTKRGTSRIEVGWASKHTFFLASSFSSGAWLTLENIPP